MDSFTFNKIAGAVLSCLLLLVGLHTFVEIFYPKGDANVSKGMIIVTQNPVPDSGKAPETGKETAQAPKEEPLPVLLAKANVEAGQAAAKKCAACHNWKKGGGNAVGPNLYGIVGRDVGKVSGFAYSSPVAQKGGKWEAADLNAWIKNPKAFIPGNKMAFAGVESAQERANIIAYLNSQSDSPITLVSK